MTEERIKELAEEWAKRLIGGAPVIMTPGYENARNDLIERQIDLIRTVAAEVREEGRKEGINELCNSLSNRLRRGPQAGVALIVEDEAERLKEKGE